MLAPQATQRAGSSAPLSLFTPTDHLSWCLCLQKELKIECFPHVPVTGLVRATNLLLPGPCWSPLPGLPLG